MMIADFKTVDISSALTMEIPEYSMKLSYERQNV